MNPILRIPSALRPFAFIGAFFVAACGSSEPDRDEPCSIDTSCGPGQYCADGACIAAPEAPIVPGIAAPDRITAGSRGVAASIEAPQAGITYVWTIDGGAITSDAEGDEVRFDVGGGPVVELTVEATNVRGQEETATRTIAVAPVGDATISAPDVVTALRSGLVATVPAQPGASFAWEIAGGTITDGADTASMTFTAGEAGTITLGVIVTNAVNDAETTSAEVRVVAPPDATIAAPAFVTVGTAGVSVSVQAQVESTFAWTVDNGTITDGDGSEAIVLTAGDPGETLVSVTVTNAAGDSTTDTVSIETVSAPSAAITTAVGPITTRTSGLVASVPPAAYSTFAWTVTGGTITAGQGTESITFEAGAIGTLHIVASVTSGAGVTATGASTVQIVPAPIAEIAAPTTTTEGTADLVASVAAQADSTFAWTLTNGTITAGQGTDSIVFTAGVPGSMLLSVTVTNAAGDAANGQAAVEAFPTPLATLVTVNGPITTGKPGFVASVPAQPGSVYTWTITGGTITAGHATESITFAAGPVGALTLSVTVTNAANASATAETTLDIIAAPDAQVAAPTTTTEGTAGLVASVPAQADSAFAWTVTNGTITAGQGTDSIVFTAGVPGPMLLSVTVTNAAGDAANGQAAIEAFPTPLATLVTVSGPITTGKPGFVASVPAQPGSVYTWAIIGGTITAGQATESITFAAGPVGTLALSVTVTNAANASATAETTLDIIAAPDAQVTAPTTVTEGTAGLVALVPAQADSTFAWTVTNGTITAGQGTNSIVFTAGVPGPMLLSVTVTNAAGDAANGQAAIEAFPTPLATLLTVSGPITTGKPGFVASVPAQPGSSYVWAITGGMITAGQHTESLTFAAGPVGTLTLSVTVANAADTSATAETTLDVIAAPDALVSAPTTVTAGKAGLHAFVLPQANSTFTWTLTNATITTGQGSDSITFTAGSTRAIDLSVTVTNAAGDGATETRSITVIPAPNATITAPSGPFTEGAAGLTASVPPQANVTYSWTVSGGAISIGQGSPSITYSAGEPGDIHVSVVVMNTEGEIASDSFIAPVVARSNATITAPDFVTAGKASLVATVPEQTNTTILWTITGGTLTAGQGSNRITFTAGGSGQLALSVSVTNAAADRADESWSITIVAAPVAPVSAPTEPVTTGTGGLVASVPGQPDSTYSWSIVNGTITAGGDTSQIAFTAGSPGQTQIQCTVTNRAGERATEIAVTPVVAQPDVNITATVAPPVIVDKAGLIASVPQQAGVTYDWTVTGGTITSGADTHQIVYSAGAAGTLTLEVVVTNAAGDGAAGAHDVTVWAYFSRTGNMTEPRKFTKAVTLTDGRVLVTGGQGRFYDALRSAEVYRPTLATFSAVQAMSTERYNHTATLLDDGKVLIAGGSPGTSAIHSSAELFDPGNNSWTPTGSMAVSRYGHTATLLADGRVLVAGGEQYSGVMNTAEIYDPATGTWSMAGSLATGRTDHSAVLLLDGRVLVAGGATTSNQVGSAEIFDPVVGTWSPAGSTATTHAAGTAVRLSDGRVLLAGGETGWIGNSAASEIYDPASGLFTPTPAMITARWGHQTALLGNGRILQAGGAQNDSHNDSHYYRGLADAEMYDPTTDTYLPTLNLAVQRAWAASAVLLDGRVLILGGHTSAIARTVTYDTTPAAELFHY